MHGERWLAAPRFPLAAKGKVRAIDDGTACGINGAHTASERLRLGGVDEVAALARAFLEAVDSDGPVTVRLPSGEVLQAPLAEDLLPREARQQHQRWPCVRCPATAALHKAP